MIHHKHQRVGVFIDVQNLYYSARNLFNRKVNFGNIVKKSVGNRQLIRATAYVVSTKTGENQAFFDALYNLGIETKEKELMEYDSGQKKADWDVGITVDAIASAPDLDVIVLVSGDGDYIPLVEYLQSRGKFVEVMSFRETTSGRLIEAIGDGNYINLSASKRSFLIPKGRNGSGTKVSKDTEVPVPKDSTKKTPVVPERLAGDDSEKKPLPKKAKKTKRKPTKKRSSKPKNEPVELSSNEAALNN